MMLAFMHAYRVISGTTGQVPPVDARLSTN